MSFLAALSSLGSSVLSGGINLYEGRKNREFQADMSNTAYQRAAQDLEKAGLNRILAFGQPASTPAGSMGTMPDLGQAFSSGMSASSAKKMAELAENKNEAEIDVLRSQQESNAATARQLNVLTGKTASEKALIDLQAFVLPAEVQARIGELNARAGSNLSNSRQADALAHNIGNLGKFSDKAVEGLQTLIDAAKGLQGPLTNLLEKILGKDYPAAPLKDGQPTEHYKGAKAEWQDSGPLKRFYMLNRQLLRGASE